MVLRPRRRRPDWLVVAGVLALVGVVLLWLGLSAVAGVDAVQIIYRDPVTGLDTVPGPSVGDASVRDGWTVAALGAAALVGASLVAVAPLLRAGRPR